MQVPTNLLSLTAQVFFKVRPATHAFLRHWRQKARSIPDPELRRQAQDSLETKTFHCEGGALFGLLADTSYRTAVEFIVAYQTLCDYLDNLCDRGTSQDPEDFLALHESVLQALSPGAPITAYYRHRREREDGGYIAQLVKTCQNVLTQRPSDRGGNDALLELARLYIDLQVHKHVRRQDRLPRLQAWFAQHEKKIPPMAWYEFAACAGSTLGIFCIVSTLFQPATTDRLVEDLKRAYFPWVQGLHILLDYLIDQEEDRQAADLNFCAFYPDRESLLKRLSFFYREAQASVAHLPNARFHRLVNQGLLSIYLADEKVPLQKELFNTAKKLLKLGGLPSLFFFWQCRLYRKFKPGRHGS